jgi:hypothetical protein
MKKFKENDYQFVKYFNPDEDVTEGEARQQAMYVSYRIKNEKILNIVFQY